MLKETLPHMRAARKGQVIVVTSLVGFKGFAFTDAYTASKFALEGVRTAKSTWSVQMHSDMLVQMTRCHPC